MSRFSLPSVRCATASSNSLRAVGKPFHLATFPAVSYNITVFEDRREAGFLLAKKLEKFAGNSNILVLGMARGGVLVAKVISTFLNVPMDIFVVKKIGAPNNPELAVGGVAPGNTVFWNEDLVQRLGIKPDLAEVLRQGKEKEREKQEKYLRGDKPLEISGKTVILVDDGVATGASVVAGSKFLRKKMARGIILAVPVIAKDTLRDIKEYFDDIIFLKAVEEFHAVGQFYKNFPQIENEEVKKI